MKYNIGLLHYSCPPIVGGVEEIMRQHASLLSRYYHNVKVFAGDGGKFAGNIAIEINPLLGSRNRQVIKAHQASVEGKSEKMENLTGKIYEYLLGSLKGFDVLIAHNVLTMPFNLPLSTALHRIGQEGLIPIISWNHDSPYFYPDCPKHLPGISLNGPMRASITWSSPRAVKRCLPNSMAAESSCMLSRTGLIPFVFFY